MALVPRPTSAALSLALPQSDYPRGATIAIYPATNREVDYLLGSAHRSSFQHLRRIDGVGWVQAALWSFSTGRGAATQHHRTTFGYAINVFHNARRARAATRDAKIPVRQYRVAHLPGLFYSSSDGVETLNFLFFAYTNIEIELYYEYRGTAPVSMAKTLRHVFNTQASHLAHLARLYRQASRRPAPATRTPVATPSPTPTDTPLPSTTTPTISSTPVLPTSTATPSPTATPAPTGTPTSAPVPISAAASTGSPTYAPNTQAEVIVHVTANGAPVPAAKIAANFAFPGEAVGCSGVTDASGTARCSVLVPEEPDGTKVSISIQVVGPHGELASTSTTFVVQGITE